MALLLRPSADGGGDSSPPLLRHVPHLLRAALMVSVGSITPFSVLVLARSVSDTSILHHAFISIFIAFWVVITHYVTILMPILSYFTRFT